MNLIQTNGKLNGYYRRYVDETTTPIQWDQFDASQYDDATLERGRRAWLLRTMDEYRSMVGFSEMTHIAAAMHAPIDVVACSSRVVRDEVRHVEICSTLMDKLGGQKEVNAKPNYVRTNPKHQYRVRAMQLAIGSCCIGETISVIMLAGVREQASDPVAHAALTQMLKDESFHSRFGWLWLESMNLDDRDRRWLDQYIPRVFGSESHPLPPLDVVRSLSPHHLEPSPARSEVSASIQRWITSSKPSKSVDYPTAMVAATGANCA